MVVERTVDQLCEDDMSWLELGEEGGAGSAGLGDEIRDSFRSLGMYASRGHLVVVLGNV